MFYRKGGFPREKTKVNPSFGVFPGGKRKTPPPRKEAFPEKQKRSRAVFGADYWLQNHGGKSPIGSSSQSDAGQGKKKPRISATKTSSG